MPKIIIWILVFVGLLFFVLGLAFMDASGIVFGFLLLAGGLFLGLRPGGILRKEEVVENWSALVENGQGKAEDVFKDTRRLLDESKAPNLGITLTPMAPGFASAIIGERRDFLVITQSRNPRLQPYQMFLNCRDYGNNLAVDWHVTFRPTFWQAVLSLVLIRASLSNPLLELDLFDQQDLRAYVTNAHRCLVKAVQKLMLDLSQDVSSLDRRSRGFLGIS